MKDVDSRVFSRMLQVKKLTLWPWPLTYDLENLQGSRHFDGLSLYQVWSNNNLCTWQNAFSMHYIHKLLIHHLSIGGWFKRMELIEVKRLIWAQKGKLYIIHENLMWILGILRFKSIHLLFYTFIHIIPMYTRYFKW